MCSARCVFDKMICLERRLRLQLTNGAWCEEIEDGRRVRRRLAGHADLNFWLEIERQMAVPSPGQPTRLPLMAVRRPASTDSRASREPFSAAPSGQARPCSRGCCALVPVAGHVCVSDTLARAGGRRGPVTVLLCSSARFARLLGPALVRLAADPSRFSC